MMPNERSNKSKPNSNGVSESANANSRSGRGNERNNAVPGNSGTRSGGGNVSEHLSSSWYNVKSSKGFEDVRISPEDRVNRGEQSNASAILRGSNQSAITIGIGTTGASQPIPNYQNQDVGPAESFTRIHFNAQFDG